jgi:glycosyltransferase involved in cell wall biosynthesis
MAKGWTGLSYFITAHGSDVPGYNPDRFLWEHKLLSPLWKRVVHQASRIACPSEHLRSLVLKQNSEASVDVVPNGIDFAKFDPDKRKRKRILVVTRMFERKGVQYFLRSLEGSDLGHEVHIVGDGPYLGALRALADELKVDVKFWGELGNSSRQLIDLYETSTIFILASEAENFPIVLLEAMASAMAIVTTRGTGCAEVVGDTGLLVEPRDPDGLRHAIVRLVKDPELCGQLGRMARKRLETRFGWSAVGDRYLDLYKSVKNGNGNRPESAGICS